MRAVLILFLLALLAVGAWFALRDHDTLVPPAPPGAPAPQAPSKPAPAQATVRTPAPVQPAPTPAGPGEPAPAPTETATPAAAPNVILAVRAITTREPVPAFRWQFRNSRGTQRGEGTEGHAELALEASAVGELLVEAEGLSPLVRPGVIVPTPPAGPLVLDLFLGPTVPAAGITLFVRDQALAPVTSVRVEAFQLANDAPQTSWQLGRPLWARRNPDPVPDGRYVLPTLAPGNYGIRVLAVDDKNVPLPLLPWLRTFALTGDNGFVEDVALEPGALLALDLVDAAGQPYDSTQRGAAALKLRLTGGPDVRREWIVQNELAAVSAVDALPGVGTVHLAEAVIAGPYSLDVIVQSKPRVRNEQMFLRPGIVNSVRVVVP